MTDRCNFSCTYCYQPRGTQSLEFPVFAKVLDHFIPHFAANGLIDYYGGEPLLAFDELRRTVGYVEKQRKKTGHRIGYCLTTNGSLLDDRILGFLDEHGFLLTLSFDGLAQDISREKGSFDLLVSLLPKILARPRISLETNSVFSPETVPYLSSSVKFIIRMGVPNLNVHLAHRPPWTSSSLAILKRELDLVGDYFESRYRRPEDVSWKSFYELPERAVHGCPAGQRQMALSAQGTLWGCPLFPHYFVSSGRKEVYRKYCFGDVDSFLKSPARRYARKAANYAELRMDGFSTPDRTCLMCREIEQCSICPLAAALTTGEIGLVPAWRCQEQRMSRRSCRSLLARFKKKARGTS